MARARSLRLAPVAPVEDVVALLEDALARARRGEYIGIGIVAACDRRSDATSYVIGDGDIATLARLLEHGE